MNEPNFNVHLASHYGVCFGVRDAIDATRKTFNEGKVTVLGQLVHNPIVDDELKRNHVRSGKLRDPSEDITGTVIITAHGASNLDKDAWRSPNRKIVDTTCPLVRKAHDNLFKLVELGYKGIFKYDEASSEQLDWFYHLTGGHTHTDFFAIRSTDYSKANEGEDFEDVWS